MLKGDKPLKIHWTLNNETITAKSHEGITVMKNSKVVSVLSIESVDAQHSGNYTCVASNHAGIAELSTQILVNGDTKIIKNTKININVREL